MGNPVPHSEVVNKQPRVLIIGYGHVGHQMGRYFTQAHYVDVDQIIRLVSNDQPFVEKDYQNKLFYDLGIISVPTPPKIDGSCDTSAVQSAYDTWKDRIKMFCIKSAVTPGFTKSLGDNVCVSPEYYGETLGHPLVGANPEMFIILGGPKKVTSEFAIAWSLVTNSNSKIYQTDSLTAEICKLMENSWIATKVSFCNQFYDISKKAGIDWNELRELWLADPRVSRSHTYVYPNNRGWGGKCLPKDIANLCHWVHNTLGFSADLMESICKYNKNLRDKESDEKQR